MTAPANLTAWKITKHDEEEEPPGYQLTWPGLDLYARDIEIERYEGITVGEHAAHLSRAVAITATAHCFLIQDDDVHTSQVVSNLDDEAPWLDLTNGTDQQLRDAVERATKDIDWRPTADQADELVTDVLRRREEAAARQRKVTSIIHRLAAGDEEQIAWMFRELHGSARTYEDKLTWLRNFEASIKEHKAKLLAERQLDQEAASA